MIGAFVFSRYLVQYAVPTSVANANRPFLERDEVALLQLAAAATLHRPVDGHGAACDRLFGVAAGVDQLRELQELPKADAFALDNDFLD